MAHQQEISDAEWQRAKKRGADAARDYSSRGLSKDAASSVATTMAAEAYHRLGSTVEEESAFYQGFMGKFGF